MLIAKLHESAPHPWQRMHVCLGLLAIELAKGDQGRPSAILTVVRTAAGIFGNLGELNTHLPNGILGVGSDAYSKCSEIRTLIAGVESRAREGTIDKTKASVAQDLADWVQGAMYSIAAKRWVEISLADIEVPPSIDAARAPLLQDASAAIRSISDAGSMPESEIIQTLGQALLPCVQAGVFDVIGPPEFAAWCRRHLSQGKHGGVWLQGIGHEAIALVSAPGACSPDVLRAIAERFKFEYSRSAADRTVRHESKSPPPDVGNDVVLRPARWFGKATRKALNSDKLLKARAAGCIVGTKSGRWWHYEVKSVAHFYAEHTRQLEAQLRRELETNWRLSEIRS